MPAQSVHAFSEKVALITDGENPVGRAVALQLAMAGCYVVVGCGRKSSSVLRELQSLGTLAAVVHADVSTSLGIQRVVEEIENSFGRIDLLVNCLKIVPESSFEQSEERDFNAVIGTNFGSTYFVTKACLPLMKQRPKPRIVNVVAREKTMNDELFAAVNAAALSFTRSLAKALSPKFRVNAVISKFTRTIREGFDPELLPLAGSGSADDTARAVLFLLSEEAAGVNGQVIEVAG